MPILDRGRSREGEGALRINFVDNLDTRPQRCACRCRGRRVRTGGGRGLDSETRNGAPVPVGTYITRPPPNWPRRQVPRERKIVR